MGSTSAQKNDTKSYLWGPYRPNLYFGLRPRLPQSLMTGLVWFGTHDYQSFSQSRHACDQGDGLSGYTWTEYDPKEGGVQVIKDPRNNVQITTEYLKVPGGDHGGSWAARLKGEPINDADMSRTSLIFYSGIEGIGGLEMETYGDENGIEGPVKLSGNSPDLGDFVLRVVDGPNNNAATDGSHANSFVQRIGKTHFLGVRVEPGEVWRAQDVVMQSVKKHAQEVLAPFRGTICEMPDPSFTLQLPDKVYSGSNLFAIQKTFDGKFEFDVFYESKSAKETLGSLTLTNGIAGLKRRLSQRYDEKFPVPSDVFSPSIKKFSQSLTCSLMGGVGYFYGASIVDPGFAHEWDEDKEKTSLGDASAKVVESKGLLTATPSRSFFPRGFYWDEGFHLIHIGEWDNDFSLEILKSWIDLIDENGWIAREQILGDEARSKVPAEFITQVPSYANPPTLTMVVTAFIDRLKSYKRGLSDSKLSASDSQAPFRMNPESSNDIYLRNPELARTFVRSIYPKLRRHYDWFRRTQRGQINQYGRKARSHTEGYRWRGRTPTHILTSGMDDYPRGPAHAGELHLDLISWMAFFTRTMRGIASYLGEIDDEQSFTKIEQAILNNIEDLHWSEEDQMYCDVGVDKYGHSFFVCHKGYLSLFPMLLGLLPSSSLHLGPILDLLDSKEHLWSPYGIRSLSASHPEFGKGENYWKGPIWIQMNYMVLSSLHKIYAKEPGPHQARAQDLYQRLRKNIIENVYKEYERTGYVWEQYDALTGEGRRSHPFTGWSSLVALIISEKY